MAVFNGTPNNDVLFGGSSDDQMFGSLGNDLLFGFKGKDTLAGNEGDDELYGDSEDDLLLGGKGKDTLRGNEGDDELYGNLGEDALFGGTGNDLLTGGEGNDELFGEEGNDLLTGNAGDDRLFGILGDDVLRGGKGKDFLAGGEGDDVLDGNFGADIVLGGAGRDVFAIGRYAGGTFPTTGGPALADADIFEDFSSLEDSIAVTGTLKTEEVQTSFGTGAYAGSTILSDKITGNYLAIIKGIRPEEFTKATGMGNQPPVVTGKLAEIKGEPGQSITTTVNAVFSDPDDPTGLSYTIENQSSFFTVKSLNSQTGSLTLNLGSPGFGAALVRATDPSGLFAQTSFSISVSLPPPSDPPPTTVVVAV